MMIGRQQEEGDEGLGQGKTKEKIKTCLKKGQKIQEQRTQQRRK